MNNPLSQILTLAAILTMVPTLGQPTSADSQNPIDAYVAAPDDAFGWQIADILEDDGVETVLIDMTSQRWLTTAEVDRPLWTHRLILTIPKQIHATDIGFFYIGGGSNTQDPPSSSRDLVKNVALATNTVVAQLGMVPNQPLIFHGDGQPRYEDDLIAYAWVQFLETGDPKWLPRNAMVKSAVRAMDVVSQFMQTHREGRHQVNRFVVGGGSKRGWTTWLTGAMDDRVIAIVPIVIDVLSVDVSMRHHFAAYGFWAPSIGDYVNHGIMQRMGTDELKALYDLTDPFSYVNRLNMPQFVVNAAGDQFFLPDSSQFYWDQLKSPKLLRYVANTDHGLGNSDGAESVAAFHYAMSRSIALPELSWSYASEREIDVTFGTVPSAITLWQATNTHSRDFRMETFGPGYKSTSFQTSGISAGSSLRFAVDSPPQGWTAWFVEMSYDIGFVRPLKLSTEIRVTPKELPFQGKPPNLSTSITFVIHNTTADDTLFDEANAHLSEYALGSDLSVTTQSGKTFINFVPRTTSRNAMYAFYGFLQQRFDRETKMSLQLESGIGATLEPLATR